MSEVTASGGDVDKRSPCTTLTPLPITGCFECVLVWAPQRPRRTQRHAGLYQNAFRASKATERSHGSRAISGNARSALEVVRNLICRCFRNRRSCSQSVSTTVCCFRSDVRNVVRLSHSGILPTLEGTCRGWSTSDPSRVYRPVAPTEGSARAPNKRALLRRSPN